MAKIWAGVTAGITDPVADDFNSSLRFDSRMYRQDIRGSMARRSAAGWPTSWRSWRPGRLPSIPAARTFTAS